MKLSDSTLTLLKNFSTINNSILFKPGNVIKTISQEKNIIGEAEVPETFTNEFGIFDLHDFLSVMSLFKDPTLNFEDNRILIKEKNKATTYRKTDSDFIKDPFKIQLNLPDILYSFELSWDHVQMILKASSVRELPDLTIQCEDGNLSLLLFNKETKLDKFIVNLNQKVDTKNSSFTFKCEDLKLLKGVYQVELYALNSSDAVGKFKRNNEDDMNLSYYIIVQD